jgi:hypothetical protein
MDTGDFKYVMADATGPTSRWFIRNYRHFLWIGDVILIIDDLKTFEPGQFEWLLHVDGEAERRGRDLRVSQDGASVLVRPLFPSPFPDAGVPSDFPEGMRLVEKTGPKHKDPDTEVTYYAFAPAESTRRTKFITAMLLVGEDDQAELPQLERLEGNNYIGVRVRQGKTTTDVYLNLLADGRIKHRNSNTTINGWQTDAYLLAFTVPDGRALTDPDALSRCFVAHGCYLRRDDAVILDSLSKVFVTVGAKGDDQSVLLDGQPVMNVTLRSARRPSEVLVNGRSVRGEYDASRQALKISIADQRGGHRRTLVP